MSAITTNGTAATAADAAHLNGSALTADKAVPANGSAANGLSHATGPSSDQPGFLTSHTPATGASEGGLVSSVARRELA